MSMNNFYDHLKNPNIQFFDEITDDLKCKKCTYIMEEAHAVPCGCCYCFECVKIIINSNNAFCIMDGNDCKENILRLNQNVFPNFPAIKKIESLRVICLNNGCEEIVQLKKIDDHLNICRFTTNVNNNLINDNLYNEINDLKCQLNYEMIMKEEEQKRLKKELEDERKMKELDQTRLRKELEEERKKKEEEQTRLKKELEEVRKKKELEQTRLRKELEEERNKKELEQTRLRKELEERNKKELEQTRLKKELEKERKKNKEIEKLLEEKKKNENKRQITPKRRFAAAFTFNERQNEPLPRGAAAFTFNEKFGFMWIIENVKKKMEVAENNLSCICSEGETMIKKYCVKLGLTLNYVEDSIYLQFMTVKGNYDNEIPWPCCLDFHVEIVGLGEVGEFIYEEGIDEGRDKKWPWSENIKLCTFQTLKEFIKINNLIEIKIKFYCTK